MEDLQQTAAIDRITARIFIVVTMVLESLVMDVVVVLCMCPCLTFDGFLLKVAAFYTLFEGS